MKNKKIFGKKQLVMAGLVVALGAAVWLNMEYSATVGGFETTENLSSNKNLGDTKYVMTESVVSALDETDEYFSSTRSEREKSRNEALAILEDTKKDVGTTSSEKTVLVEKITQMTDRIEKESSIESLIKAKNFEDAIVIIGDNSVNVIVKSDSLLQSQILQIQDAVTSQLNISLEKIKIVNRK